jgi:hypothetical protein
MISGLEESRKEFFKESSIKIKKPRGFPKAAHNPEVLGSPALAE